VKRQKPSNKKKSSVIWKVSSSSKKEAKRFMSRIPKSVPHVIKWARKSHSWLNKSLNWPINWTRKLKNLN
jgi:hypothetical protein